jgi:hypothetical protein
VACAHAMYKCTINNHRLSAVLVLHTALLQVNGDHFEIDFMREEEEIHLLVILFDSVVASISLLHTLPIDEVPMK